MQVHIFSTPGFNPCGMLSQTLFQLPLTDQYEYSG